MCTLESSYCSDISSTTCLYTTSVSEELNSSERICANDSNLQENNDLCNPANLTIEENFRLNEALICHVDSLPSHEISSSSHNLYNNEDSSNENAEDKIQSPQLCVK